MNHILTTFSKDKNSTTRIGWTEQAQRSQLLRQRWIKLAPYGLFSHPEAIHRFLQFNALTLVNNFNSISNKIYRSLCPPPLYFDNNGRLTQIGKIIDLEARNDGLYAKLEAQARSIPTRLTKINIAPVWQMVHVRKEFLQPNRIVSAILSDPELEEQPKPAPKPMLSDLPEAPETFPQPQWANSKQVISKVHAHMDETGLSYIQSWKNINQ